MCTGLAFRKDGFYFGRNLDLDWHFGEQVAVVPENALLTFKEEASMKQHYAMMGMAFVADQQPLFAEAINEKGLGMAGLNFPGYAVYPPAVQKGKNNVTPYEIITWTLAQFESVDEAVKAYENLNLVAINYSNDIGINPLHWILADKDRTVTVESTEEGLKIYDNPFDVLTNNPDFKFHMQHISNFMGLSTKQPASNFKDSVHLKAFGQGLGAFGLPGDFSPTSRFVKAAFVAAHGGDYGNKEGENPVCQFFHILDSVKVVDGAVDTGNGMERTLYTCCMDAENFLYYYKTYENPNIGVIRGRNVDLQGEKIVVYPLVREPNFAEYN